MRRTHVILIGMLIFSLFAMNLVLPVLAEGPRGTRSPDAGVELIIPSNKTGKPTEIVTYEFTLKNSGDSNDNFTLSVQSAHAWETNLSRFSVGPLEVSETATVYVNVTIPIGAPADTMDELTFSATSVNDPFESNQTIINTTVVQSFVVEIEIEGGISWTSGVDPPAGVNSTLILRNYGNENVTITLNYLPPLSGWNVTFPRFPDRNVFIEKADTTEGMIPVNITIFAPAGAQPNDTMTLTLWGEKTDLPVPWYSYDYQNNITITTIVQPRLGVIFHTEKTIGFVSPGEIIYNFTLENSGNKDIVINLTKDWPSDLIANLDRSHMTVRVDDSERNALRVSAAPNAPQGNYTINISALDNTTGQLIGGMEFYYVIVPTLNITNISFSDEKPVQFRSTYVYVTIENTGYVDAVNITVKLYDGSKKIGEKHLEYILAGESNKTKIKWAPDYNGNRSIRVSIDVQSPVGNFSIHGSDISQEYANVEVKVNWQPYYLIIYIIIVIILGFATLSSIVTLKYYSGVPHINDYAGTTEEGANEEFPEDGTIPEGEKEEDEMPFGAYGPPVEQKEQILEPRQNGEPKEDRFDYQPKRGREPEKRDIAPPKDPETLRTESELKEEIAKVQDKLDKIKSQGVDTSNIYQLIKTAKKSGREGNYNKTKQYIGYANERIDNLTAKRNEAETAIKEAKEVLSGMRGTADLTIVENFLVKADSLFEEGNFREAINYANKAKERALRLQRREMRL